MPNQTPNYNLTKPLTTENYDVNVFNNNADIIDSTLKNIDSQMNENTNDISNLKTNKQDTIEDSGWLDMPLDGNVLNYSTYDSSKYRKINKTVKCTGRVTNIAGTTGTIGTLPAGYRPIQNSMFTTLTNGVVLVNILVYNNGNIVFNSNSSIPSSNFITLDGIIFDV